MQIKKREAMGVLKKLRFEIRETKERFAKFYHAGKLVLTTAVPYGQGELHVSDRFRKQLRLSENQLTKAKACTFNYPDYISHLRDHDLLD